MLPGFVFLHIESQSFVTPVLPFSDGKKMHEKLLNYSGKDTDTKQMMYR